ncbi:MFS transporter [Streptomyces sp. S1A]|uniref:MFS transporter n=1 Tax=Streptomyces sp. ICN903 TaxID=2964654 RepID=UPI001EDA7C4B|nr:MFS transporter [Streptomyces sp. ICN903]MCG3039819.1 MFS transporter [Streptomyces sp. ICN903]
MTAAARAAADAQERGRAPQRRSAALAVISAAQLMFLLDATIVNVALPSIQRSLGLDGAALEWVVASYSIAFGGLLMLGGRAGDILGRRRMFAAGLALFTCASLLGGLASQPWLLVVCRAAQGAGAAAASPAALSLIAVTFRQGPERDRAIGWYTAVATAGGGLGLLAGGVITAWLSWRWVMLVNVPIGVVLLAVTRRVLPEAPRRSGVFDASGAVTGTLAALLLVYGLVSASSGHGGRTRPEVLAALGAATVLLAVFVAVERRGAQPLVPLRLFTGGRRAGVYAVLALTSTAMFGVFFFLTLFLSRVWGYSSLRIAVVYLPLTCLLVAGARVGPRLVALMGARALVCCGLLTAAAGMAWLSRIGESGGYATGMLVPTVLVYAGLGVTGVPLTLAALADVADEDSGAASGLLTMARQIGGATGLAVLGAVVWAAAGSAGHRGAEASDAALSSGIAQGFLAAAAVTALSLLPAAFAVPGKPAADVSNGADLSNAGDAETTEDAESAGKTTGPDEG